MIGAARARRAEVRFGGHVGRIYFWPDKVLYLGPGAVAGIHAHHAVQLCVPLSARLRLRSSPTALWRSHPGAVIPSDVPHESDVQVALLASLWVDAGSPEAKRLVERDRRTIRSIPPATFRAIVPRLRAWWDDPHGEEPAKILDRLVGAVAPSVGPSRPLDPRVERARRILDSAEARRVKLADVAAAVSLSPSRLAHLVRAELGLPVRRYLLWLRLRDAVGELVRGGTITEAAHAAGFADAPHLDRTFRRMLGFTPSVVRHASTFVQDLTSRRA